MSRFILVVIALLFITCSKDDPTPDTVENEVPFAITILARQGATDFQIDLAKNGEIGTPVNLFQKLELPESTNELIIRDQLVSYHDWLRNDYSSHQIDILTEEVAVNRNYCFDESNFEVIGIANTKRYLTYIAAKIEQSGGTSFSINVYDLETQACQSKIIPSIAFPNNFMARGDHFILFQEDSQNNKELLVYDLKDLSLEIINLNDDYNFSVLDTDHLYVFNRTGSYQILAIDNLTLVNAGSHPIFQNPIADGVLDLNIQNGKMEFFVLNPQPSTIESSPILYDFDASSVKGDSAVLFAVIDALEAQVESPISIKTYRINLDTEQIVVGYNYFQNNETEIGGVVFIDFEGGIVFNKELDLVPKKIVF